MTMKLPKYFSGRSAVFGQNMVATSQPLAVHAGIEMLRQGGNAVDAALATAICLTVVEPTGNGVGSDAYAIVWDGKKIHGLNASGRSPKAWSPEVFKESKEMPLRGWQSVTVPGAVSSWVALSEKFGKLDFKKLFEPAIHYARDGFMVSPIIADLWKKGADKLADQPGFAQAFMPNNSTPKAGELFVKKDLAHTLTLIANTKGDAFYKGQLADQIIAHAKENGSLMTHADLAEHRIDWCGTINMPFGNKQLHEIPPNGQGIAALMALGMVKQFDLSPYHPDSAHVLHIQIEAIKLAFHDLHQYVADIDHMQDVNVEHLLDEQYLQQRATLISLDKAQIHGPGAPKKGGTVYLSTADKDDMMVSFIQSNYEGFGSGVVVPNTGISMQNRGNGFTLEEGHPNQVAGGKRPFQTIIPAFLMQDDTPLMSFGVMGGPMQAQGHLQMMVRTQIFNQSPQAAIDAPRWRFFENNEVLIEEDLNKEAIEGLKSLGHKLSIVPPDSEFGFGGAQIIKRLAKGQYEGGSDFRKDGLAFGY